MPCRFGSSGDSFITTTTNVLGQTGVTYACRIRVRTDRNAVCIIFAALDSGGNGNNMMLDSSGTKFRLHSDSGSTDILSADITLNVWYTLIGTVRAANDAQMWWAQDGETSLTTGTTSTWTVPAAHVKQYWASDPFGTLLDADLEHCRLWTVAFTQKDAEQLWLTQRDPQPRYQDTYFPMLGRPTLLEDWSRNAAPTRWTSSGTILTSADPSNVPLPRKRRRVVGKAGAAAPPPTTGRFFWAAGM